MKRLVFSIAVVLVIFAIGPAQAIAQAADQAPDALTTIEQTRGGRHWVNTKMDLPKTPAESLKAFQIEPGLKIELVAAEPLVRDLVAIAFDRHGRMFVAEYSDYPVGPDIRDVHNRSAEAILHDILDPIRGVEPRFTASGIITKDDRSLTALLIFEAADSVILQRAGINGTPSPVPRSPRSALAASPSCLKASSRLYPFNRWPTLSPFYRPSNLAGESELAGL
jgi:hypothetical protein